MRHLVYEPTSGKLWVAVNERDMLGSDLVPDYMTRVEQGDDYGWPWFYWGEHRDERVPLPSGPNRKPRRPDYALGPHTASLGLVFASEARLGTRFANGAFVGQHGSWNRVPVSGYKVVYVPFASNGMPEHSAKPIDVLSGFLDAKGRAQGRPVGVVVDSSGGLLIADDVGNVIWQVAERLGRRTTRRQTHDFRHGTYTHNRGTAVRLRARTGNHVGLPDRAETSAFVFSIRLSVVLCPFYVMTPV